MLKYLIMSFIYRVYTVTENQDIHSTKDLREIMKTLTMKDCLLIHGKRQALILYSVYSESCEFIPVLRNAQMTLI